ncbi:unnamed protein product [Mytilus coruscus]|uniref:MEGF10_11 n=1 Tax=Mytilus coruscus TaxID=42192 RepID=A0A6J8CHX1_MYTCO|nr:unnamed protein product [Mytilus coruscus]
MLYFEKISKKIDQRLKRQGRIEYSTWSNKYIACKTGYKSRNGQPCKPCSYNFHGKGCGLKCKCSSLQRCDNINGCISIQTSTLSTEQYNAGIDYASTYAGVNTVTKESDGISKRDLLIYSGTVTCIIVLLGLCHCYNKYRKKGGNKLTSGILDDTPRVENNSTDNAVLEMYESVYHTIDEDQMANSVSNHNSYLEVIDRSSSSVKLTSRSESIKSTNSSGSGYLHPYHGLIATSNDHLYEQSRRVNEVIDPNVTDITGDQYQDCFTPTEKKTETLNYLKSNNSQVIEVFVHQEERSYLKSVKDEILTPYDNEEKINSEQYKKDSNPTESEHINL